MAPALPPSALPPYRPHMAQVALRKRAGICADSKLEILAAEKDMYVARVTGTSGALTLKLGPRYDMGGLVPKKEEGWAMVTNGKDYALWEKKGQ